jgi:RNA polymerase sigma-70 factor (ECF subfamily)
MFHCNEERCSDLDDLVVAARTDRESFGRLYEAYYERILRYCHRRLFERTVSEDVCGDVFVFVARNMRSFRGTTEQDFRRWIYRIATTEINAYVRQNRRRVELWHNVVAQNAVATSEAVTNIAKSVSINWPSIHRALNQLSVKEQTVLTLRLFDELPYEEIAHIMAIRPGTVRVTYSRALKRMRERLLQEQTHLQSESTS